jgi:hypothetical protein
MERSFVTATLHSPEEYTPTNAIRAPRASEAEDFSPLATGPARGDAESGLPSAAVSNNAPSYCDVRHRANALSFDPLDLSREGGAQ